MATDPGMGNRLFGFVFFVSFRFVLFCFVLLCRAGNEFLMDPSKKETTTTTKKGKSPVVPLFLDPNNRSGMKSFQVARMTTIEVDG
jgi:hypothetical protein